MAEYVKERIVAYLPRLRRFAFALTGCPDPVAYLAALGSKTGLAAICTGAMILAVAGCLGGHAATTKVEVIGEESPPLTVLGERHPAAQAYHAVAVRSGRIVTSSGVSLGIDGVLYVLGERHGHAVAHRTHHDGHRAGISQSRAIRL